MEVEVIVPNSDNLLKPNDYVEVSFQTERQNPPLEIPSSALVMKPDGPEVAVVDADSKVNFHKIKIAQDMGSYVEVATGLEDGDRVALNIGDIAEGEQITAHDLPPEAEMHYAPKTASADAAPTDSKHIAPGNGFGRGTLNTSSFMQPIRKTFAMLAAAVLMLPGCRVGPNYKPPTVATPDQFDTGPELLPTTLPIATPTRVATTTQPTVTKSEALAAATRAATQPTASPVDLRHWWTALDDSELNSLIDRAVQSNLDVAIAIARVQEVLAPITKP